jgi:uncharacterized protein (DUF1778 family)
VQNGVQWEYNLVYSILESGGTNMAGATATTKETRLSLRASESEKKILARAARARHMNTSQFVLQASLDAAHAVLGEQTAFRLPPEQWEAFRQRLDAPARDIPSLRALFGEPEPYDA